MRIRKRWIVTGVLAGRGVEEKGVLSGTNKTYRGWMGGMRRGGWMDRTVLRVSLVTYRPNRGWVEGGEEGRGYG